MHRDDRGVVERSEVGVLDRLADQRRRGRNDRFAEAPAVLALRSDLVCGVGRGDQPRDSLQLDDRADDARKDQPIVRADERLGRDRRDDRVVAVDFEQEQALELTQAGVFDRLIDQTAFGLNEHLDQILAPSFTELFHQFLAFGQQPPPDEHDVERADDCGGETNGADLEKPHPFAERFGHVVAQHETVNDHVRAGADQRTGSADDREKREGHQEA